MCKGKFRTIMSRQCKKMGNCHTHLPQEHSRTRRWQYLPGAESSLRKLKFPHSVVPSEKEDLSTGNPEAALS